MDRELLLSRVDNATDEEDEIRDVVFHEKNSGVVNLMRTKKSINRKKKIIISLKALKALIFTLNDGTGDGKHIAITLPKDFQIFKEGKSLKV